MYLVKTARAFRQSILVDFGLTKPQFEKKAGGMIEPAVYRGFYLMNKLMALNQPK